MNTLMRILATSSLLLLGQSIALAQNNLPANDASTAALVEVCKNQRDQDAQNFCFGFGEGVYQAYLANRSATAKPEICFSQQSETREAILQDFLRWNQANPQFNRERAATTLMRFLKQTYPCK